MSCTNDGPNVADWVVLAFAPSNEVELAIDVGVFSTDSDQNETSMELVGEWGNALLGEAVLINKGALDVTVTTKAIPTWFTLLPADLGKGRPCVWKHLAASI
jgi:uncharacterized protein YfaP (DUF2135 family)